MCLRNRGKSTINDAKDKEDAQKREIIAKQDIIDIINTENEKIKKEIKQIKDSLLPTLPDNKEELKQENISLKRQLWIMKSALFFFGSAILIGAGLFIILKYKNTISVIISLIAGLGGFWSFINLIINLIKSIRK